MVFAIILVVGASVAGWFMIRRSRIIWAKRVRKNSDGTTTKRPAAPIWRKGKTGLIPIKLSWYVWCLLSPVLLVIATHRPIWTGLTHYPAINFWTIIWVMWIIAVVLSALSVIPKFSPIKIVAVLMTLVLATGFTQTIITAIVDEVRGPATTSNANNTSAAGDADKICTDGVANYIKKWNEVVAVEAHRPQTDEDRTTSSSERRELSGIHTTLVRNSCGADKPTVSLQSKQLKTEADGTHAYLTVKVVGLGVQPSISWGADPDYGTIDQMTAVGGDPSVFEADHLYKTIKDYAGSITASDAYGSQINAIPVDFDLTDGSATPTPSATPSPTTTATPTQPVSCKAPSWKIKNLSHKGNRFDSRGFKWANGTQPHEAADKWLKQIRVDSVDLKGAILLFTHHDVDSATLTDANGCASKVALSYASYDENAPGSIVRAFAHANVSFANAPVRAYVVGIHGKEVVRSAEHPDNSLNLLTGNRSAVKLTNLPVDDTVSLRTCGAGPVSINADDGPMKEVQSVFGKSKCPK